MKRVWLGLIIAALFAGLLAGAVAVGRNEGQYWAYKCASRFERARTGTDTLVVLQVHPDCRDWLR